MAHAVVFFEGHLWHLPRQRVTHWWLCLPLRWDLEHWFSVTVHCLQGLSTITCSHASCSQMYRWCWSAISCQASSNHLMSHCYTTEGNLTLKVHSVPASSWPWTTTPCSRRKLFSIENAYVQSQETYQCDLLEVSLAFVQAVDLRRDPIEYNRLASLTLAIGISVRFSTSMYPDEPICMERLHFKCQKFSRIHQVGIWEKL